LIFFIFEQRNPILKPTQLLSNIRMKIVNFILFFFLTFHLHGQDTSNFYLIESLDLEQVEPADLMLIESSLSQYHASDNDTLRLNYLSQIVDACNDEAIWPVYNLFLKKEAKRLLYHPKNASHQWSTKVASVYALAINNEGYSQYFEGDFESALASFQRSLTIREQLKDTNGVAECYNNLGGIYYGIGSYENSITYFKKSLKLKRIDQNPLTYATSLNNIGSIYNALGQLDSAAYYYNYALALFEKEKDQGGLALCYHNLASIHGLNEQHELAHLFFLKSIRISKSENNQEMVATSYALLAKMHHSIGDVSEAKLFAERSYNLSIELGYPDNIMEASKILYLISKSKNNTKDALSYFELYSKMKDSVQSIQVIQDIAGQQITYEFEKKAYADSLLRAEENQHTRTIIQEKDATIERDLLLKISLSFGILFLLAISFVIYAALKNNRKAKEEIAGQKTAIEEEQLITEKQRKILSIKNKEILDSINYAKRLQEAILPSVAFLSNILPDHFILFRPKDIVAGDFYWVKEVGNLIYFAAADCTGHGVPGAFVSLVCNNALDKTILDLGAVSPSAILEHVTTLVVDNFDNSTHAIKDGMDIALCSLNRDTLVLQFSGANNPLWLISSKIQSDSESIEFDKKNNQSLFEIKATKQPVGKYNFKKDFENHSFQLQKGDQIYLCSDGYADQFGGEKGKKFKYRQMKSLILQNAHLNKEAQKTALESALESWMQDFEQVDDICIFGVKV
jgi:serine phosphatase RsbU (regulator of sigma subunit)